MKIISGYITLEAGDYFSEAQSEARTRSLQVKTFKEYADDIPVIVIIGVIEDKESFDIEEVL